MSVTTVMDLQVLLARYRPGSYDWPWSWTDETKDLMTREPLQMRNLMQSMQSDGLMVPVLLAPKGHTEDDQGFRVWDGHHRVVAARLLQWPSIPVREYNCSCHPTNNNSKGNK